MCDLNLPLVFATIVPVHTRPVARLFQALLVRVLVVFAIVRQGLVAQGFWNIDTHTVEEDEGFTVNISHSQAFRPLLHQRPEFGVFALGLVQVLRTMGTQSNNLSWRFLDR